MFISLFFIIALLILLTFVWPPDSPWSPWWRTNKKIAQAACVLAKVSSKDVVYELGSGDGEFILTAALEFDAKSATGIEIDYSRYYIALIKKNLRKAKKAFFLRKDFKKVKLNDADVVYFYLVPFVIKRILPKLKRELKPGTRIVSYRYEVPLPIKSIDKKNGLFLYII
jgi:16S rRNA A1518/A1519 N6-dimethyltransferase RsmA/KsgA/DIM1 with predicted DNA glycosylase/AP lyase activity